LLESVEGAMQKSPLRLAIARCDDRPQPTASLRERSFTQRKLIWREAYRLPQSNRSPNLTPIEIMQKQPIATAASPSTPRETRVMFLAIVVLLIAGVVAYHNCFSAPFLFDDDPSIADNPTIRKLWPPWEALSPPATGASVTSRPVVNYSAATMRSIWPSTFARRWRCSESSGAPCSSRFLGRVSAIMPGRLHSWPRSCGCFTHCKPSRLSALRREPNRSWDCSIC
jgi:hypothetical protein